MKQNACLIMGCLSMVLMSLSCRQGAAEDPSPTAPAPQRTPLLSSKVIETMDSGGYTYVLVNIGSQQVWAASAPFPVKVGDSVLVPTNMPMRNFNSKTLNRTFDLIYFAAEIRVGDDSKITRPVLDGHLPLPTGHPQLPASHPQLPPGHPSPLGTGGVARVDVSGIERPAGGKTVAEIHAEKAQLAGKEATVRGKVVKFNSQIMGKNWIHIQDGSASGENGDLTLTAGTPVKVGNTVLVSGVIATNKDFGFGYKYGVLMEDCKITVEAP